MSDLCLSKTLMLVLVGHYLMHAAGLRLHDPLVCVNLFVRTLAQPVRVFVKVYATNRGSVFLPIVLGGRFRVRLYGSPIYATVRRVRQRVVRMFEA